MIKLTLKYLPTGISCALLLSACTLKMQAPEDPIVINLNIKVEHEIRVKVDKELDTLMKDNPDLFG